MLHEPRRAGASDHASVVAKIDIGEQGADQVLPHREITTATTDNEKSGGSQISEKIHPGDWRVDITIAPNGNLRARFDLAPGSLSDMTCGLNGQKFVQQFRPTYVTAEWASGILKEVQIWGPRLLQDGSLGKRELDHQWKRTVRPAESSTATCHLRLLRDSGRTPLRTTSRPHRNNCRDTWCRW